VKVDTKTAEASLSAKGFRRDKSKDHIFFYHVYEGQESGIKTFVSHGSKYKDIGPDNLKSMTKQLGLRSLQETRALLECPMSESDYNEHLLEAGRLDRNR
jgi:hypothetical protein